MVSVLEFFDEHKRPATVTEISRYCDKPQSSISELISVMLDMGLVYQVTGSRRFALTARVAMLGYALQPTFIRNGDLSRLTNQLSSMTGLGTAVFGMVEADLQVFHFTLGAEAPRPRRVSLAGGAKTPLSQSAAGWLLLSTLPSGARDVVIRQSPSRNFNRAELRNRISQCGRDGYAVGPAGFGSTAQVCATLLPTGSAERPLALGCVHDHPEEINQELCEMLGRSVQVLTERLKQQSGSASA